MTTTTEQAVTIHPLRLAIQDAEAAYADAFEACQVLDQDDAVDGDSPEYIAAIDLKYSKKAALEEAKEALAGSDCPRYWQLIEEGNSYDVVLASSSEEALAEARDGVERSNYADATGTFWIDVRVHCEETGETDSDTVTCEPDEPDCTHEDGHDWQSPVELVGGCKENPGVHGNGGGVIITKVCMHCGCKRITNTWAQRRDTGEQGLTSVEYEEEAFDVSSFEEDHVESDV